jgi:threonine dehydrogenase-like Zn-dependent dehydrogenase
VAAFETGKKIMKAITLEPLKASTVELSEIAEPEISEGSLLVKTICVGVCGTDIEITQGKYGWAPVGQDRLVLGHESLGIVEDPGNSEFSKGDLVVGIVRQPDPEPCYSCAIGEWDMCKNGRYKEHGIKELNGFMREFYRIDPRFCVRIDKQLGELGVLMEPTSVVAKAWEEVEKVGSRSLWQPKKAVVTGAGPIGLLAAMIGVQKGLEVHVIDQVTEGLKPDLVKSLGAIYHTGLVEDACKDTDIVIECTGVGQLVFDAMGHVNPGGVVCLTGVSSGGRELGIDAGAINRSMVLENECVVGSVNANKSHYEQAAAYLKSANNSWLSKLITRKVSIGNFGQALDRNPDDVKVVIQINDS